MLIRQICLAYFFLVLYIILDIIRCCREKCKLARDIKIKQRWSVLTVDTNNFYGNISISDDAIAVVAGYTALDCYGVVDLISTSFKDNVMELFKKKTFGKGIKITSFESRIFIDVYCILKYGVSISAVAESMKKSIKYKVENFTGMIVDTVNVHVVGVRV